MALPSYIQYGIFVFLSLMVTNLTVLYLDSFAAKQAMLATAIPLIAVVSAYYQRSLVSNPSSELCAMLTRLLNQHTALVRQLNRTADATNQPAASRFSNSSLGDSVGNVRSPLGNGACDSGTVETTKKLQERLLDQMSVVMYASDLSYLQVRVRELASKYVVSQQRRLEERVFHYQSTQLQCVVRPDAGAGRTPIASVAPGFPRSTGAPAGLLGSGDRTPFGCATGDVHCNGFSGAPLGSGSDGVHLNGSGGGGGGSSGDDDVVVEHVARYGSLSPERMGSLRRGASMSRERTQSPLLPPPLPQRSNEGTETPPPRQSSSVPSSQPASAIAIG